MAEDKLVLHITSKELSKVEKNLLNTEQLGFLLKKTPKAHIYERPAKGGGKWKYVTGVYVKKVLNLMFGWDWSFEVKEYKFDLVVRQAYVLGRLTVTSGGKTIIKEQFGRVDIKFKKGTDQPLDIGNDLKAATTDALKKCAAELGVASDVYNPQEYTEITVVDEITDEDKVAQIKELLEVDGLIITEEDRLNYERIIDEGETDKYDAVIKTLIKAKPKK